MIMLTETQNPTWITQQYSQKKTPTINSITIKSRINKPPPIYIHSNIKLLDTLKDKYKNAFQIKFTFSKLKIMFENINYFSDFKSICKQKNTPRKKTTTVVFKSLIKLPESRISNSIKNQGLNPIACTEIPTLTKYPIYRITFAPGTSIAQINYIRCIKHIKIYWEKFESHKPTIQCFRCQIMRAKYVFNCDGYFSAIVYRVKPQSKMQ